MNTDYSYYSYYYYYWVDDNLTNMTYNYTNEDYVFGLPPPNTDQIVVAVVFCVMAFVGIMGNLAVVAVIVSHRDMRSATNLYILNYAIADLIFLIICAPVTAKTHILPWWQINEFFCKLFVYMQYVSMQATSGTLTALTVDRCYVLMNPIRSIVSRTKWRVVIVNCSIWLVSLLLHIPAIIYYRVVDGKTFFKLPGKYCAFDSPTKTAYVFNYMYVVIVTYVIPLAIISTCYCRILHKMWNNTSNEPQCATQAQDFKAKRKRQQRRKLIRMVLIMVSLFAICWAPLHAMNLWVGIRSDDTTKVTVYIRTFCLCLAYANSCFNPFVYAFAGRNYRTRLYAILRRKRTPTFQEYLYNSNGHLYSPSNLRRPDLANTFELSSMDTCEGQLTPRRHQRTQSES